MHEKLEACLKDWSDLAEEYQELERKHKDYRQLLDKSIAWQKKCVSGVTHQKYRLNVIKKLMKEIEPTCKEEEGELEDLRKDILRRQSQLNQMMEILPTKSGRYLRVIMGNVDVSILDKNEKYRYKEQYESFKLIVNLIGGILATTNFFLNYRVLDLVFFFLIVWYYCTLTIRESILIVNGSRIKGWWRLHHFISLVVGGVLLVWPDGIPYRNFRDQNMLLNIYVALLQYLQYLYQKGCLYRLRSLGERQDMDITIDGFHSWMWKGLGFLLPFLYIGYVMQLYNSYTLYILCSHPEATWQVPVLCGLFLLLGAGNLVTTSMTIPKKWMESKTSSLKYKFVRLDKYFWSHRRRRTTISQDNPEFSEHVDRILRRGSSESRMIPRTDSIIRKSLSENKKEREPIEKVEEEASAYTSDELDQNQVEVNERVCEEEDEATTGNNTEVEDADQSSLEEEQVVFSHSPKSTAGRKGLEENVNDTRDNSVAAREGSKEDSVAVREDILAAEEDSKQDILANRDNSKEDASAEVCKEDILTVRDDSKKDSSASRDDHKKDSSASSDDHKKDSPVNDPSQEIETKKDK